MKCNLLILVVLFTMVSSCSFTQEERTVLKLSSDGKLASTADFDNYEDIEEEDADEPSEPEILNPMSRGEMSAPEMLRSEMPVREMSHDEMPVREMSRGEMPVREMSHDEMLLRDN
jgi:hypothetical protein